MRLRKLALTDPAAAFLLPIFERLAWSQTAPTSDERLDAGARRLVAAAPAGVDPLLARALDATPTWRLAGDAEAALAIRILGARQSRAGLTSVLRVACDLDADDADSTVGLALRDAIKEYASSAMDEMIVFAADRRGDLGVLPSYLLAADDRATDLALSFLRGDMVRALSTLTWHMKLVSTIAARRVTDALPPLIAAIERISREDVESDPVLPRAVVGLATAVARLGGQISPAARSVLTVAEAFEEQRLQWQEALAAGAYARELEAAGETTPRVRLSVLGSDPLPMIRAAVAGNPHTPPDILGRLVGDASPEVRCAVAVNAMTPEAAQEQLAYDLELDVRLALALCRDLYPRVLEILARDPDSEVRERVVAALPVTLLREAATDVDPDVRQAVPWNPSVPAELLDQLAADPDPLVRAAVAAVRGVATTSLPLHAQPTAV